MLSSSSERSKLPSSDGSVSGETSVGEATSLSSFRVSSSSVSQLRSAWKSLSRFPTAVGQMQ